MIAGGAETELVLKLPRAQRWAIEIKRSSAPKLERGFFHACQDIEPQRRYVVYNGTERYKLNADTEALGLRQMVDVLASLTP